MADVRTKSVNNQSMYYRSSNMPMGIKIFEKSKDKIVLVTMDTTIMDQVTARDNEQWRAVQALEKENTRMGSRLSGKPDTSKMGIMGWSMGGGATWINASKHGSELSKRFEPGRA